MHMSHGMLWTLATGLAMTASIVQAGPATFGAYLGRREISTPTALVPKPMLMHKMTGVSVAHEKGYTGKGVKIGIIGGGLYYKHPALGGGCYGQADCKVVGGYDFVGDNYNAIDPNSKPEPDNDPYEDCEWTTTFQAGVLAGQADSFLGVAPGAQLSAYRVFSCVSPRNTKPDLVLSAMQKAYDDGCSIIYMNVSVFPGMQSGESSMLAEKFAKTGVVVVLTTGFYGDESLFRVQAPGAALSTITSTAADSDQRYFQFLTIQAGTEKFTAERTGAVKNLPEFKANNAPVTFFDQDPTRLQGCERTQADFEQSLVLMVRGNCTFAEKIAIAVAQGASGVIFFNHVDDPLPTLLLSTPQPIPATIIPKAEGEKLLALLQAAGNGGQVTVSANNDLMEAKVATGGRPSKRASQGPSNELDVKPELLVPGSYFYSSTVPSHGIYEAVADSQSDGAYLTGCVALLLEAGIPKEPEFIRRMLMASALPLTNAKGDAAVSVAQQGAGMINLDRLLSSNIELSTTKFALLDPKNGGFVNDKVIKSFSITNYGTESVTYEFSALPADSVTNIDKQGQIVPTMVTDGKAEVKFSLCEVTVEANATVNLRVQFTEPSFAKYPNVVYSGYIQAFVKGQASETSMPAWSFPYLGLNTDFNRLPMFPATPDFTNPALYRNNPRSHVNKNNIAVFTMKDGDVPGLYIKHLFPIGWGAAFLAPVGQSQVPYAYAYVPFFGWDRAPVQVSSFDALYTPFTHFFDINSKEMAVADGHYVLTFAYASPFERDYNKATWSYWTSPEFEIKRA